MITEIAQITIRAGSEADFEAAFAKAIELPAVSSGYVSHELKRSIESPNRYVLIIQWRTLEDHTVGFRGSTAFTQWRAYIRPHFESAPVVEHFTNVSAGAATARPETDGGSP
jgi:heme-degrading monooxygenase HmoA